MSTFFLNRIFSPLAYGLSVEKIIRYLPYRCGISGIRPKKQFLRKIGISVFLTDSRRKMSTGIRNGRG